MYIFSHVEVQSSLQRKSSGVLLIGYIINGVANNAVNIAYDKFKSACLAIILFLEMTMEVQGSAAHRSTRLNRGTT